MSYHEKQPAPSSKPTRDDSSQMESHQSPLSDVPALRVQQVSPDPPSIEEADQIPLTNLEQRDPSVKLGTPPKQEPSPTTSSSIFEEQPFLTTSNTTPEQSNSAHLPTSPEHVQKQPPSSSEKTGSNTYSQSQDVTIDDDVSTCGHLDIMQTCFNNRRYDSECYDYSGQFQPDKYGRKPVHYICIDGCEHRDKGKILLNEFRDDIECSDSNGWTPLLYACVNGHLTLVQTLISDFGADVNHVDENKWSALHYTCACGNFEMVTMLLSEFNAKLEKNPICGCSELMLAAIFGHEKIVEVLISKYKCSTSIQNNIGFTALHHACRRGNVTVVESLVANFRADAAARDSKMNTPLHIAALNGRDEVVLSLLSKFHCKIDTKGALGKSLIHFACAGGNVQLVCTLVNKYNANLQLQDDNNSTPLHIAALAGREKVVVSLVDEFGCDVTERGVRSFSLLHSACVGGNVRLVKLLIHKYGADVNAQDYYYCQPIHVAAMCGREEVVIIFLNEFGCDIGTKCFIDRSLLHAACMGGNVHLVKTLIQEFNADVNARDEQDNTPLYIAALNGHKEVVVVLLDEFSCNKYVNNYIGNSLLHVACVGGNIDLVETLINEYDMDVNARNDMDNTPLENAIVNNKEELAFILVKKFGCDINEVNCFGSTMLHSACAGGNVSLVRTLIRKYKANVNVRNRYNRTPLHCAAEFGREKVVVTLLSEFMCNANSLGYKGSSLLHYACVGGNVNLVQILIQKYNANVNAQDEDNSTPLHMAVHESRKWFNKFGHDLTAKQLLSMPLLERSELIRILVKEHKAIVDMRDNQHKTPLHVAALNSENEAVITLLDECNYDANIKDSDSNTILHYTCASGNLSLVRTLILKYKCDIKALNKYNNTPLFEAAKNGRDKVVYCLLDEFGCEVNIRSQIGTSLLHCACQGGNISLVQTLVQKYKADICTRDEMNNTPVHLAACAGKEGIVSFLLRESPLGFYKKKGQVGGPLLHFACIGGNVDLVRTLIEEYKANILCLDDNNDTPLHYAVQKDNNKELVKFLLKVNASRTRAHVIKRNFNLRQQKCLKCLKALLRNSPTEVMNRGGLSPLKVASNTTKVFLEQYVEKNIKKVCLSCNVLREYGEEKFCSAPCISRIFVIGNTGVGKSSLIETLKREDFLSSIRTVSESSVPLHTAGIVPSIHRSKLYGRVLLYDFAGDPEYYSSHAAILQNLSSSDSTSGTDTFIIVVNLSQKNFIVAKNLRYWLSFIRHHNKSQIRKCHEKTLSLVVIGSHAEIFSKHDILKHNQMIKKICKDVQHEYSNEIVSILLDCRKPRSDEIKQLRTDFIQFHKNVSPYNISVQAKLLLGILEKDFSAVSACSMKQLVSHIQTNCSSAPIEIQLDPFLSLLQELHDIGLLLLIRTENPQIILDPKKLTNEAHHFLFSPEVHLKIKANDENSAFHNLGLLPESFLSEFDYVSKECLVQLQYCQQISPKDVGIFTQIDSSSRNFYFFPSLIQLDKRDTVWAIPADHSYSIGWLARCDKHDFFPTRFLHVLLLRLVFRFTLSAPDELSHSPDQEYYHRYCKMWKTGVHWLMEEGVECMVELAKTYQDIVVYIKSLDNAKNNCVTIFRKIVSCVMEVKAEFCNFSSKLKFFLLDSINQDNYLKEDNLFAMSKVEKVLASSPEDIKMIVSCSGTTYMCRAKAEHFLHKFTIWHTMFPIDSNAVVQLLRDAVQELFALGIQLDLPISTLQTLEANFPRDVNRRRIELVIKWMSISTKPPCWWSLVKALKSVRMTALAKEIEEKYCTCTKLQEKLLDFPDTEPDAEFLKLFASIVSHKWSLLATAIATSEREMEEVKKEGSSHEDCALKILKRWVLRNNATYGQLYKALLIPTYHFDCTS